MTALFAVSTAVVGGGTYIGWCYGKPFGGFLVGVFLVAGLLIWLGD